MIRITEIATRLFSSNINVYLSEIEERRIRTFHFQEGTEKNAHESVLNIIGFLESNLKYKRREANKKF